MAGFLKIDTQTLTSTTYIDKPAWDVFFAAMLIAAQYAPLTVDEPMAQLEVRTLEHTGWLLPPGEYGFAPAAGIGIVKTAQLEREAGMAALERLGMPEPDSRSQACQGRRLVRVDGGYIVINMVEFRQRDQTAAERQRRRRARLKAEKLAAASTADSHDVTRDVTAASRQVTEAEAEADADVRSKSRSKRTKAKRPSKSATSSKLPPAEAIEISQRLYDAIVSHTPGFMSTQPASKVEQTLLAWAVDIDRAMRGVGNQKRKSKSDPQIPNLSATADELRAIVDFAHSGPDDFWHDKLVSGASLRAQAGKGQLLGKARKSGGSRRSPLAEFDFVGTRERMDAAMGGSK